MKKLLVFLASALFSVSAFAQSEVSGTVTDSNGAPVPGVSVFVEGTMNATSTDLDGRYSIKAGDSDNLLFSCLGYEEVTRPVGRGGLLMSY